MPALLKHRHVWRDVLLAALALQLIALAAPLFMQAILDKVAVHRTQSTLIAIGAAMVIFTVFSCLFTLVRQHLVLHTGNRVDALLGAVVWERLPRLPNAIQFPGLARPEPLIIEGNGHVHGSLEEHHQEHHSFRAHAAR